MRPQSVRSSEIDRPLFKQSLKAILRLLSSLYENDFSKVFGTILDYKNFKNFQIQKNFILNLSLLKSVLLTRTLDYFVFTQNKIIVADWKSEMTVFIKDTFF